MTKKIRLNVDDLRIESFATTNEATQPPGTVFGQDSMGAANTCGNVWTCNGDPTCAGDNTCYGANTCGSIGECVSNTLCYTQIEFQYCNTDPTQLHGCYGQSDFTCSSGDCTGNTCMTCVDNCNTWMCTYHCTETADCPGGTMAEDITCAPGCHDT